MADVDVETLLLHGLEHYRKFYGIYRGEVIRNDDPEKRGRIQAHVPAALQTTAPDVWIDPAFDGAGTDRGNFWPPEIGDSVRISFERGDPRRPCIYWGGWFGAPASRSGLTEVPSELGYPAGSDQGPTKRGCVTRLGHSFVFDETPGSETVQLTWHQAAVGDPALSDPKLTADRSQGASALLSFTTKGVKVQNANGSFLYLDVENKRIYVQDENGNKVTMDSNGVKVDGVRNIDLDAALVSIAHGADTFAVRGSDLLRWLSTHTHPTSVGPSGPPMIPPPPTILSQHVRLK